MSKGLYAGVDGLARKVKTLYASVFSKQKPIYEEGSEETIEFTPENMSYFAEIEGSEDWTITAEESISGSISASGIVKFTPLKDNATITLTFKITYENATSSGTTGISLYDSSSGTTSPGRGEFSFYNYDIYPNLYFTITASSASDYFYFLLPAGITINTGEIIGYEDVYTARKVKKGYIGVNGIAKLFYSSSAFGGYTGDYTVSQVSIDNTSYDLYTLTTSGVLTLDDSAQFWMCGGGGGGMDGDGNITSLYAKGGYGGGGGYISEGTLAAGEHAITIGAGGAGSLYTTSTYGGDSMIGSAYTAKGGNHSTAGRTGASGGGSPGYIKSGSRIAPGIRTGVGSSTIPFGITGLKQHSAGGGGGQAKWTSDSNVIKYNGAGAGGSDGGNGSSNATSLATSKPARASGGEYGGGYGGAYASAPSAATFYGSGGGGGYAEYDQYNNKKGFSNGKAGYQGVLYLLIPT